MDRQTRRRLEDLFRSANWSDLTDKDMAAAGVPEARRPEFLRRAAAIRAAYAGGSQADAQNLRETAVQELADVLLEEVETAGENSPAELAKQALGERSGADADDSPRRLADGLSIW